jgi:serine O-acetyltransferase
VLTPTRRPDAPVSTEPDPNGTTLLAQAHALHRREPLALPLLRLSLDGLQSDTDLLAALLASALPDRLALGTGLGLLKDVLNADAAACAATLRDVAVTTCKNFEPGGEIATLLFSRGIHAILAHRVAHALWISGKHDLSLAVKTMFGRVFSTDIHPGAAFGSGVWLDHGLSFVVGETAVIEDEVSIWHGVTLGSTLKDAGNQRHPQIRRGATICADAIVLGNIEVGEGSVVAAGAVVLTDVAPFSTVAGVPARLKQRSENSFSGI